ncbi:hypothetical protein CspHIS471_0702010 [Cutaneotrichosporon sp. HIS471]|nr:hypothetical protein CspHIS471_0702010 [Cutaneotrichosporon sp. HIS471]
MPDVDEFDDYDSGPEPDDVRDRNYSPVSAQGSVDEVAVGRYECVICLGGGGGCFPPAEGYAVAWGFKLDNRGGRGFWRFCVKFENWSAAKGMSEKSLKDLGFDTDAYRRENPDREYARLVFGNHMRTDMLDPNPKRLPRFPGPAPTPSRLPNSPMTLRHRSSKRPQTSEARGAAKRGKHRALIEDSDDSATNNDRPSRGGNRHASYVSDSVIDGGEVDDNVIPQLPLNMEVGRQGNIADDNGRWARNATPGPSRLPGRDDQEVDGLVTSGAHHAESDEPGNGPVEVIHQGRPLTLSQTQVDVKSPEEAASTSPVLPAAGSPSGPRLDLPPPPSPLVVNGAADPPPASHPITVKVEQPQAASQQTLQQQDSPAEVNQPNAPVRAQSVKPKVEPEDGNLALPLQPVVGPRGVSGDDDDDGYFEITGIKPSPLPRPRVKVEPSSTIEALPTPASSSSAATNTNVPPAVPEDRQPINRPAVRRLPQATPGPQPVNPGWTFGVGVNLVEEPVLDLVVTGTYTSLYTSDRQPVLYGPRCRVSDGAVVGKDLVYVDVVRTKAVTADMERIPIMAEHTIHRVAVTKDEVRLPVIAIGNSKIVIIYIRLSCWIPFHIQFYDPSASNPFAQHSFKKGIEYQLVFTLDSSVQRQFNGPRFPPPVMVDHLFQTIVDNFRHGEVANITLVGCEDWPRGWCIHMKRGETPRAYCARMFAYYLQEARFQHFAKINWGAHERLTFVTMDDYKRHWDRRQATYGAFTKKFYNEK